MRRLSAVLAGMAATSPVLADSGVEHAGYSVAASAGAIEIRDYAPQIVAETTVAGERGVGLNAGFRRLAGYIFGANAREEKIAMTAPVAQTRDGEAWKIRFSMPARYSIAALPRPNDGAVTLARLPGKRMAAIRFSGLAGDADLAVQSEKLLDYVKAQGLTPKGPPLYAFYDPPWTLPWNRRNEVMVEIPRQ